MKRAVNKTNEKKTDAIGLALLRKLRVGVTPNSKATKHERFLQLLKSQYGYTNEKAIEELKRILTQFHAVNRSLSKQHLHANLRVPPAE
jgi:hypothetical protein